MSKYRQILIFFILIQLPAITAVAQQGIKLQVLTPPPPDVSALGKFGLVPVDNFTGVPSISIPVYTIQDGTLEFPISLDYHAGGIKVKEDASEVGLGWALSAGGSITSATRGHPDFQGGFADSYISIPDAPEIQLNTKSAYYSLNGWFYQWVNNFDLMGPGPGGGMIYSGLTLTKNNVTKQYYNYFAVDYYGQAPDFASDLYTITIGNKSYKFIFDNNFKPVVLGDGALKIELINFSKYPDWKVTDENGIVYYFTERQFYYTNSVYPPTNGGVPELNTWHLTKIVSPTYGEINFKYQHSATDFISTLPVASETYLVGNNSPHTQQNTDVVQASYTMYEKVNIDSIQFSTGYVKFTYAPSRLDLKGALRLQTIEVRDKSNHLVKKTALDNNYYFTAASADPGFSFISLSGFTSDNISKRLKLSTVSEVDVTDTTNYKQYSFTYNEQLNLPSKLSLAIDHWGYYNGASNSQLVPPVTLYLSSSPNPLPYSGANRNANPETMQANTLTSVQYPTGGTTNFTYETNQFERTETVITYHDESSQQYKAAGSSTINASGFMDASGNFTVPSNWSDKKLEIVSIIDRDDAYSPSVYKLDIIVKRDGAFLKRIPVATTIGTSMTVDSSLILEPGNYNISFDPATPDFFKSCDIRLAVYVLRASWTSEQVLRTIYSGGLRTSVIRNTDPIGGNVNTKTFTYFKGTQDDLPVYESAEGYDPIDVGIGNPFRYRYGQSIYPFCDGRNAPYFGYQKVEVREVDGNNNTNGLSEFNYSTSGSININTMMRYNSTLDQPKLVNPVMAAIPDIAGGDRGKLFSERHYKLVNGTKIPVSSTSYYYTRDNSTTIWQMLFNHGLSTFLSPGFNNEQVFRIYAHHFPVNVLRNMLRHKEDSTFDSSGSLAVTKAEDYTYDNINGHFQLIKKSTINSKGDTLNTWFKYVQDYGDLSAASNLDVASQGIKNLQQKHVITPVEFYNELITVTPAGKKYFGGQINVFNNNLPTIKQIYGLETPAPLTTFTPSLVSNGIFSKNSLYTSRIQFTQYDGSGRLLEQSKENDTKMSYIWDYNSMRPVAEATNAAQSDIAYTSFEAEGKGNWTFTGTPSADATAPTGSKCYILGGAITRSGLNTGTTYVVSYWKKSGTVTVNGTVGSSGRSVNGWTYYEHNIVNPSGGLITVSGTSGIIDELRLCPKDAQMTSYTYDPLFGITSQTDTKGQISYFEYDGFGRLMLVKDQNGKILKQYDYQYQKPVTQ